MYLVIITIVSACKLLHLRGEGVGASNNDPAQGLHALKSGPGDFVVLVATL